MALKNVSVDDIDDSSRFMEKIAQIYHSNTKFRQELESDPGGTLKKVGMAIPPGVEIRLEVNTPELMHVVLPGDPNKDLMEDALESVSGGSSTLGTAGTASSLPSSLFSAGSASSKRVNTCLGVIIGE